MLIPPLFTPLQIYKIDQIKNKSFLIRRQKFCSFEFRNNLRCYYFRRSCILKSVETTFCKNIITKSKILTNAIQKPALIITLVEQILNIKRLRSLCFFILYTRYVQKVSRILNFRGLRIFDFRFFYGVMLVVMFLIYANKYDHFECSVHF